MTDVESMQGDTLNILAKEVIPYLKELSVQGPEQTARDILLGWDDTMSPQSAGAAVYAYFWQALLEQTFKSKVPLWDSASLESSGPQRLLLTPG